MPQRIDHRSYARQGIEQIPTVHMGVAATQMERRGISTEKGTVNREIAAQNKLLKEIKARITRLYNWTKEQAAKPEERRSVWEQLQQAQTAAKPTTRYGKVKALKENAALFNFLQENGITSMPELHAKVTAMQTQVLHFARRDCGDRPGDRPAGRAAFHVEAVFRKQEMSTNVLPP